MSNLSQGSAVSDSALAGLVRMNDQNLTDWEHFDYLRLGQVIANIPAIAASNGTLHKYTVRASAPGTAFRDLNSGIVNAAGTARTDTLTLKLFDAGFTRDKANAIGYVGGAEAYMSKEMAYAMSEAFSDLEKQIINGTDNDASGFDGFKQYVTQYSDLQYNGGGAGGASCYMGIFGEDAISLVVGNNGVLEVGAITEQLQVTDTSTGASYDALRASILGYTGLQVASTSSYGVLCYGYNFDGTSGDALDDDALAEMFATFTSENQSRVNFIITNRNGIKQLQQSRTATTATGAFQPMPRVWEGAGFDIPIYVTDALADDDAEVTTTSA